jgi:hypothetical protein
MDDATLTKMAMDEADNQLSRSEFIQSMELSELEHRKIKLLIANGIINVVERSGLRGGQRRVYSNG